MLIEIQCRNLSSFDAALGKYHECGEKLIVSSGDIGQLVTCTKCHQQIEIPFDVGTKTESQPKSAVSATKTTYQTASGKSSAARRKSNSELKHRKTNQVKATRRPKQASTGRRPKSDVMHMDFEDEDFQAPLAKGKPKRCKKCGNLRGGGQCPVCHFVEPSIENPPPLEDIKIAITGFQRWFCNTMNEGISIKVLERTAHILFGVLTSVMITACIVSIAFGVSVWAGPLLLVVVFSLGFLYVGLVLKGHQFLVDPHAQLAWFQKPFWNLILVVARMMNWQKYDARYKGRKVITMHDRRFGDQELADLEGLDACQVLDLEGTCVSDRGLKELYRLKHLHCLVLRGTRVTHQGAFRLQQSFPRLWIWY